MDQDLFLWVVGQLVVGAAIWGGIRKDIKNIHKNIEHMDKSLSDAHGRIDRMLMERR